MLHHCYLHIYSHLVHDTYKIEEEKSFLSLFRSVRSFKTITEGEKKGGGGGIW